MKSILGSTRVREKGYGYDNLPEMVESGSYARYPSDEE